MLILEDTNPRSDLSSWAERIVHVSEPVLRKVAGVDSTQGLQGVGVLALPASFCNLEGTGDTAMNWLSSPRRVLVLDGIQVSLTFVHLFTLRVYFTPYVSFGLVLSSAEANLGVDCHSWSRLNTIATCSFHHRRD